MGNYFELLMDDMVPANKQVRQIETEFAICEIANNTKGLFQYQRDLLAVQCYNSYLVNSYQQKNIFSLNQIEGSLDAISTKLDDFSDLLQDIFIEFGNELRTISTTLASIDYSLKNPLGTRAYELRSKAKEAVANGIKSNGTNRTIWFTEAKSLFEEVLKNPIGKQDPVTCFELGWLKWKHTVDLKGARELFEEAARKSEFSYPELHVNYLRYVAYLDHLLDNNNVALQTLRPIASRSTNVQLMCELALYAACSNNNREAVELIERVTKIDSTRIQYFLSDSAFQVIEYEIKSLASSLRQECLLRVELFVNKSNCIERINKTIGMELALISRMKSFDDLDKKSFFELKRMIHDFESGKKQLIDLCASHDKRIAESQLKDENNVMSNTEKIKEIKSERRFFSIIDSKSYDDDSFFFTLMIVSTVLMFFYSCYKSGPLTAREPWISDSGKSGLMSLYINLINPFVIGILIAVGWVLLFTLMYLPIRLKRVKQKTNIELKRLILANERIERNKSRMVDNRKNIKKIVDIINSL